MAPENLFDNDFENKDPDDQVNEPKDDESKDLPDFGDIDDDDLFMDDDDEERFDEDEEDEEEVEEEGDDDGGDDDDKDEKLSEEDQKIHDKLIEVIGEDTVLKVKGKQYRAGDLSPDELKAYVQKGIRSDQLFQEAAEQRRLNEQKAKELEAKAAAWGARDKDGKKTDKYEGLPNELKPQEEDNRETLVLKETIADLFSEINQLKGGVSDAQSQQEQAKIESELRDLLEEYPLASVDEAIAVKWFRPDVSMRDIVEKSHGFYTSKEFITKALDANPTARREFAESVIKAYNSKKSGGTKIPTKRHSSGGSDKVSTKKREIARDFDKADELARNYVRALRRSAGES